MEYDHTKENDFSCLTYNPKAIYTLLDFYFFDTFTSLVHVLSKLIFRISWMHLQKQQKVCMVVCSLMGKLLWQPKNGGVYRLMNLCCFPSCCHLWPPAHPEIFQCISQTAIQQYAWLIQSCNCINLWQQHPHSTPTQPSDFILLLLWFH